MGENEIGKKAFRVLVGLNLKPSTKGFKYLHRAICLNVENPEYVTLITKNLYPKLAKEFKSNWSAVERAIRHCILGMGASELEEDIFPSSYTHYTNKDFITYVSEYIKLSA